jgi:kynurenine formamidase
MDAPIHFSADGLTADAIPVENLVVPLAIIDISARAEDDSDAQVTPDDIRAWIAEHGAIPDGACVAMRSGWDRRVTGDGFRNADADGVMHFPGFHVEAAQLLMEEANVVGMAVDTLSLDFGRSADFVTHYAWLPSNRWGLECVANLGELPASGATLVLGAPKIQGASGGPSRVIALV